MIVLLSPAKSLDFETSQTIGRPQQPAMLEDAKRVNQKLRKQSRKKLRSLQNISPQLAELNYGRNQQWDADHSQGAKQAALAFTGDVYQGLMATEWSTAEMDFANEHLRILSGLYGILRPGDLIQPYRLEMGTGLPVGKRKDLYHFWEDKLKKYFKKHWDEKELVINLASNEYFKAFKDTGLQNPVLHVDFKDFSNGNFKVVSFFAKKARGRMADYIVRNRITEAEELKLFDRDAYYYDEKSSTRAKFVFLRDQRK